ncbi:unnamed protein product, partial [Protopolystoma xenopodis]
EKRLKALEHQLTEARRRTSHSRARQESICEESQHSLRKAWLASALSDSKPIANSNRLSDCERNAWQDRVDRLSQEAEESKSILDKRTQEVNIVLHT